MAPHHMAFATKTMVNSFCVALACVSLAACQSTGSLQPSNVTLSSTQSKSETQLSILSGAPASDELIYTIVPLTENVGLDQGQTGVGAINPSGNLTLADPSSSGLLNVTDGDIAYISCDPNPSSNLTPSQFVFNIGAIHPKAIVLYSLTSSSCNLTGSLDYTTLYTMVSASNSKTLLQVIQDSPPLNNLLARVGINSTSSTTPTINGPAPTTAVAMSILYSITGIITLLFLIIIGTGALRAHRHPERYGPRTGVSGRPRQSRAKGLARAMLETLPIVKFGDPEAVKPGNREIELEEGTASVHTPGDVVSAPANGAENLGTTPSPKGETAESGMGPDTQAASIKSHDEANHAGSELGCSICTEDFTNGEDVRVLPCQHKYHPACIDPWLLNVSGTCPLCRHDLRPVVTQGAEGDETGEVVGGAAAVTASGAHDTELPPPLAANEIADGVIETNPEADGSTDANNHQRSRMSRFLDLNRLRHAPPHERIAALRHLREQSRREGDAAEDAGEEPSRRARLTGRLRETFRSRPVAPNATQNGTADATE